MELKHIAVRAGRLSAVLKRELQMSTGLINRLKWQGKLFVNGAPQHTDYPVQPGDTVSVCMDEPRPEYPAQDGPLTVLYEDAYLLAVDKPVGMLIHPSRACNTGTLANFVAGYYAKTGVAAAFHPVTRLDRDTYGVVVLAKCAHVHALMKDRVAVQKTYHAWVVGGPADEAGVIDAPIARKELPSLLREVRADGKPSRTEYAVLARCGPYTKLRLRPVTGRTHQLRVHCSYMGFPILGDPQYGAGGSHQRLCAREVAFRHPITGAEICICSKMDAEIEE